MKMNPSNINSSVNQHLNNYEYLANNVSFESFTELTMNFTRDIIFERDRLHNTKPFYHEKVADIFERRWHHSIYYSVLYLIFIYYGHRYMRMREPFNLRRTLALWSALLSIGSFLGALITVPEFWNILSKKGVVATYCDNSYIYDYNVVYVYSMFSLSKVMELFDTAFIVLRKQKLIPLHWIHHVLTLVYTFYIFPYMAGTARWMVTMNICIHAIMYGYFSLRAMRIHIPKPIAMSITIGQIAQMIFGLIIHGHILMLKTYNNPYDKQSSTCQCPTVGTTWGFLMYLLYFYFFVQFFIDSYLSKNNIKSNKKMDSINNHHNNHTEISSSSSSSSNGTKIKSTNGHFIESHQIINDEEEDYAGTILRHKPDENQNKIPLLTINNHNHVEDKKEI